MDLGKSCVNLKHMKTIKLIRFTQTCEYFISKTEIYGSINVIKRGMHRLV